MNLPSHMTKLGSLKPSDGVVTAVPQADWAESDSDSPSFVANKPTAMRSPAALSFGQKTYDGSAAAIVTAADLGALTAHQDISGKVDSSALFSGGKVKPELLPSYVDDVLEYPSLAGFPSAGEAGKIYVAKDTNKTYRWSGTQYVEVSPAPTVDSSLSPNSENPVQNKVVTAALDNKITPGTSESQSNRLLSLLAFVKQNGITLPESVYTTYGVDGLLALKANASDVATALALKADAASLPYALVNATVQTWAFSGTAAGTGNHWECVYDNGVWALYNVPDGSTWEDVPNPTDFIAGGGSSSDTEIEFTSAGVTAIKTVPLTDRAVNQVTLGSGAASAVFRFPAKTNGKARDFMLRLVITGSTVPEIGFVESDGTTEVAFDADDDSWADIEQGVNILMFTDTQEASA